MKFKPSRILNESSGFMGLQIWDLAGLGYSLVIFYQLLTPWGLELLSFVIVGVLGLALMQVRLSHRRKTIRDFCKSILWRIRL